jgi:hypothetical protein
VLRVGLCSQTFASARLPEKAWRRDHQSRATASSILSLTNVQQPSGLLLRHTRHSRKRSVPDFVCESHCLLPPRYPSSLSPYCRKSDLPPLCAVANTARSYPLSKQYIIPYLEDDSRTLLQDETPLIAFSRAFLSCPPGRLSFILCARR